MRQSKKTGNQFASPSSKRPKDWSLEERFTALQQSYSLTDDDLNAWCRERGVFTHQLEQWKIEFCRQAGVANPDQHCGS